MVRFGVIGVGAMGQEHIRNISILSGSSVTAVADTNSLSLKIALGCMPEGAPKPAIFSDYHELLASADVEAVLICTPNCHHHEVILAALPHRKHILCEKPLCTTVAECADVYERTKDYSAVFWVGMEYRYMPSVARLIGEVDSGTIGNLRMLSIREHRFPFLLKVGQWNRFTINTGGTLVEKCCHFFDLMNRIVGARPVRVYASGAQDVNHLEEVADSPDVGTGAHSGTPDILDNAFVITDFANGARAHLDLCMFAEASRHQEELCAVGDKGKIEAFGGAHGEKEIKDEHNFFVGKRVPWTNSVKPPPPAEVVGSRCVVPQHVLDAGYHEGGTYYELEAFAKAVDSGTTAAEVTALDGLFAVAIGAAAHRSIAEGRPVLISELMPQGSKI